MHWRRVLCMIFSFAITTSRPNLAGPDHFALPASKIVPRYVTCRRADAEELLVGTSRLARRRGAFGLVEIIPADDDYCDTNTRQPVSRRWQLH